MDTTLITILVNSGVAGVILVLIITGQLVTGREHKRLETENDALNQALALERQRNADLLIWASTGAKALQAVAKVAEERSPTSGGSP